nr:type II secretion system GspH family protein [Lachnospiraceae bacterium]
MNGYIDEYEKKKKKGGFTLVEMLVILAVMAIILGLSAVGALGWIAHSKQQQNKESARTIFLAMQSRLSVSESRGVLDDVKSDLTKYSTQIKLEDKGAFGLPTEKDNEGNVHIYSYIAIEKGDYTSDSKSEEKSFLFGLIEPYIFETSVLDGTFVVEFDLTAGTVHSVFYSSTIKKFDYSKTGVSTALTTYHINADSRDDSKLEDCGVGYYSGEQVNVAALSSINLRITNFSLNNDETLNLRFASNSVNSDIDTKFTIKFYEKKDGDTGQVIDNDHLLFKTVITKDIFLSGKHEDDANGKRSIFANLTLTDKNGTNVTAPFIVSYNGTSYELILDAAMSSEKMAYLLRDEDMGISSMNGLSITRLDDVISGFNLPKDIFAVAEIGVNENAIGNQEYTLGSSLTSTTENTMFASDVSTETGDDGTYDLYSISKNRHLNNVRFMEKYYNTEKPNQLRTYGLITNLNWNSNILYGMDSSCIPLNATEDVFPSIKSLSTKATLDGSGFSLQNFRLGYGSNVDLGSYGSTDSENKAEALGIVDVNNGTIENLYFSKSAVSINEDEASSSDASISRVVSPYLKSIGMLTGENYGNISNICFYSTNTVSAFIDYSKVDVSRTDGAGIGMVAGSMNLANQESITRLLIRGSVEGSINNVGDVSFTETSINGESENSGYRFAGIGSVCGYAAFTDSSNTTMIGEDRQSIEAVHTTMRSGLNSLAKKSILNQASVSGNMFTGGLIGNLNTTAESTDTSHQVINVFNEGFISALSNPSDDADKLASYEEEDAVFDTLKGFFTGGIVGYAYNSRIATSTYTMKDTSKTTVYSNSNTANAQLKADAKGFFVGGICGFCDTSNIESCKTSAGGYLVGYDYVGGITGGMKSEDTTSTEYVLISGNTTNKSYVIGHSFVGGVAGSNRSGSKIVNCNNDGAVAGYGIDIGGIVGKNVGTTEKEAIISNCSSTLYDYGSEIFNLVKNVWKFFGSNVGGQVGFNENGTVKYSGQDSSDDETTVSSVSVGKNNVGGFIGYNGTNGNLDLGDAAGYVSGRVYGTGDCVGGFIGLNVEKDILSKNITVSTNNIEGNYIVGGVIGANIIQAAEDTKMEIKYNNPISKITGKAVVGGLIGYNRLVNNLTRDVLSPYNADEDDYYKTFIKVNSSTNIISDAGNFSTDVNHVFAIDGESSAGVEFNDAEVCAITYGGGILGLSAADSKVVIKDAINKGKISEIGTKADKIKISDIVGSSVSETEYTGIIGGITGYADSNTVIDNCQNLGSLDFKYSCYGSIVGINSGY